MILTVVIPLHNMQEDSTMSKTGQDNRANQLNPNNDAYWQARGWDERPDDWENEVEEGEKSPGGKQ